MVPRKASSRAAPRALVFWAALRGLRSLPSLYQESRGKSWLISVGVHPAPYSRSNSHATTEER